jgi:peptidoglycan DL-endopeptidase CwlO
MTLADVLSRIDAIQSRIDAYTGVPAVSSASTSTDTSSAADFSAQLGRVMTSPATASGGATSSGGTGGTGGTGQQVVSDAETYLGVPYQWGGTDPSTGLDCSGLTQRTYADLGITLPRTAAEQQQVGTPVASLADAQPGDLLFFGSPAHHVAIYAGNGEMVQAPHTGEKVQVSSVADFGEPVASIRRIVGSSLDTGAATGAATGSTTTAAGLTTSTPYAADFAAASARTGVPASLLSAVAKQESGYDPTAVSKAGAEGIMQLMPGTASSLGVSDPMDPAQSINGGADYLRTLLDRFGDTSTALAAYNAGPGAVLKYGGVPPYPETQKYVANILATMGASS